MNSPTGFRIEPLDAQHDRKAFRCGSETLDRYLKQQAKQDVRRRICRVYVATTVTDPNGILGFYSLSSCTIALCSLPDAQKKRLPKHPIPAALLGRLAVDHHAQGQGLGRRLLADAVRRTLAVSEQIGIYALVVDAIDQHAAAFYRHYGFAPLQRDTKRWFLPLKSL